MVLASIASAQSDSVRFHNGNYLTGEIENMKFGILAFSAEYSDDDITVEWEKIKEIYTGTRFLINLSSGEEYYASVHRSGPGKLYLRSLQWPEIEVSMNDVVYPDFFSMLRAEHNIYRPANV